jgi:uridine kinase
MGISIGIGGVSRAGKTTLSHFIEKLYPHKKTLIISMDQYVKDPESIPKVKDKTDWEHPVSVDFDRLQNKIKEAVKSYDLVITEGILIFYNEAVNELFDKRIFIDIPKSLFYIRRKKDERWGNEPEWYVDYVWDSYRRYGQLNDSSTNTLYINGDEQFSPLLLDEHLFKIQDNAEQISA